MLVAACYGGTETQTCPLRGLRLDLLREDLKHDKGEQEKQQAQKTGEKQQVWKESKVQMFQSTVVPQSCKDLKD